MRTLLLHSRRVVLVPQVPTARVHEKCVLEDLMAVNQAAISDGSLVIYPDEAIEVFAEGIELELESGGYAIIFRSPASDPDVLEGIREIAVLSLIERAKFF